MRLWRNRTSLPQSIRGNGMGVLYSKAYSDRSHEVLRGGFLDWLCLERAFVSTAHVLARSSESLEKSEMM